MHCCGGRDSSFDSRHPQRVLLWPGGTAQHTGHRPPGPESGGLVRPLQPTVLHQNRRHGRQANGLIENPIPPLPPSIVLVIHPRSCPASKPSTRRTSSTATSNPTTSSSAGPAPSRPTSSTSSTSAWPSNTVIPRPSNTSRTGNG